MTDAAPENAPPPERGESSPAGQWAKLRSQFKRFRGPIAAIAAFGAILSGLLGYWTAYQTVEKVVVPKSAPAWIAPDAGPLSVVVLPFQNLTGVPNEAYLADGLTASLTSDLSRIRDAFIVDAATAFAYKNRAVTAQQVGRELGVHFVLQGSVQRNGTTIRINAQLADATSNAQLWSDSFEGDQSDLFALQDQVTARIGNSIGREMVIAAARESEIRKSNPKVVDLMLRARALDLKPRSLNNLQQIEDLYRQALALEPNNAGAMAGLAHCLAVQADNFGYQMDASVKDKKYVEGRELALKAKVLDPDNPEVYVPIGLYAASHGDLAEARRAAETRLALEPKNPSAYLNLAVEHLIEGEPRPAIELLTQAINLNPRHPHELALSAMGRAYFMLGDNDTAIEWFLKSAERNPAFAPNAAYLAMAYALKGDNAKARAEAAELRRLGPNETLPEWRKRAAMRSGPYQEWFESKLVPAWHKAELPQ